MSDHREIQRREVFYEGRVQGVGFRYTTQRISQGLSVSGYVKNLSDGRVRLVAEGTAEQLEQFLTQVDQEMGGYIRDCHVDRGPATGEFSDFRIE